MNSGFNKLIQNIPGTINTFVGSEFSLPLLLALYGKMRDLIELKEEAQRLRKIDIVDETNPPREKDLEKLLFVSIALGEIIEASQQDKSEFFISDARFRHQVFNVKRRPGWVLVVGNADQTKLISRLKEKKFTIFSTSQHPDAYFLGSRPTSCIYFIQNQIRYAMIYGQIKHGNPHEIGHFLEEVGPGILIVHGDQSDEESLLTLGCMLLGTPAIVPSTFPFPYGNRLVIDSLDEILEASIQFPNLRVLEYKGETFQLPPYCDPANVRETVVVEKTVGGTPLSFFTVKKTPVEDGIEVIGQLNEHLGVLIETDYDGMTEVAAEFLENIAATFPNYLQGVTSGIFPDYNQGATASVDDATFHLGLAKDANFTGEMLAQTIHDGLKKRYPRLNTIKVTIIFDERVLREKKPEIEKYKRDRTQITSQITEETVDEFYTCVSCQPFAREHVCVVTPERPPQCRKDWRLVHVGAYLNPRRVQDALSRKRTRHSPDIFGILPKGKLLDSKRGEWNGVNEGVARETGGRVKRVQIHSITGDYPHTSCGCFSYLVFYIPEVDGIGVMKKSFTGTAPNGMTWDTLANWAGGKQAPGIFGVGLGYIRSPKFLQGDGGFGRIVWMDQITYQEVADIIANKYWIATDENVKTLEDLKNFISQ